MSIVTLMNFEAFHQWLVICFFHIGHFGGTCQS